MSIALGIIIDTKDKVLDNLLNLVKVKKLLTRN